MMPQVLLIVLAVFAGIGWVLSGLGAETSTVFQQIAVRVSESGSAICLSIFVAAAVLCEYLRRIATEQRRINETLASLSGRLSRSVAGDAASRAGNGQLRFACPECGQSLEAPVDMVTEVIECPKCKKAIAVPQPRG